MLSFQQSPKDKICHFLHCHKKHRPLMVLHNFLPEFTTSNLLKLLVCTLHLDGQRSNYGAQTNNSVCPEQSKEFWSFTLQKRWSQSFVLKECKIFHIITMVLSDNILKPSPLHMAYGIMKRTSN